jgi:hypothetical protein
MEDGHAKSAAAKNSRRSVSAAKNGRISGLAGFVDCPPCVLSRQREVTNLDVYLIREVFRTLVVKWRGGDVQDSLPLLGDSLPVLALQGKERTRWRLR